MIDLTSNAINIFSLSLIFALISFSVYLTTTVLKVTDIACDSCVTLGGCVYAALVVAGITPAIAIIGAVCCGVAAGFTVASITNHIKVEVVISGVITASIIQTFTAKLFAFESSVKASIRKSGIILQTFSSGETVVIVTVVVLVVAYLLVRFLDSEYGLSMKLSGSGIIVSESLGVDSKHVLWLGLGISNGLAALSGALMAQVLGDCSTTMGAGSLVFGMAAVIVGQRIADSNSVKKALLGCFIGAILYKIALELCTNVGDSSFGNEYYSVIIAVVLIFFMVTINDQEKKGHMENF